jgi:hypothetical protein
MKPAKQVTVYRFWVYDSDTRSRVFSPFSATREAIKTVYNREPIEMTAHEVGAEDIDETGTHRRLAIGWGLRRREERAIPPSTEASPQVE